MLLGTGSNAATYCAFYFSAEMKAMQQASRHSFARCSRKLATHTWILQPYPKERQRRSQVESKHPWQK
jgi:hypothetical protein